MPTCCLVKRALQIGKLPQLNWAAAIKLIPEQCQDARCSEGAAGRGCREVNAEYLRAQWQRLEYLKKLKRSA